MRRVLVSLLAILYLAAGAGFTLREHYCMGQMIGTSLEHPAHQSDTHRCDRCGMEKKSNKGCCKDKIKILKASPDQTVAKAFSHQAPVLDIEQPSVYSYSPDAPVFATNTHPAAPTHGPPLASGLPLYLRVRCLRL
jgi:hypothetical protein